MTKSIKLSILSLLFSLLTACATNSDVENLQSQVDGLNTSTKQASADAASAQSQANDATARSQAAQVAADRAADLSEKANKRLGKKFNKSMMK